MQEKEKSAGKTAKAKEPKKSWFQGLKAVPHARIGRKRKKITVTAFADAERDVYI